MWMAAWRWAFTDEETVFFHKQASVNRAGLSASPCLTKQKTDNGKGSIQNAAV
jgi:hypothetical protein